MFDMNSIVHRNRALFYSPISFIRGCDSVLIGKVLEELDKDIESDDVELFGEESRIYIRYLHWDSEYFDCPTYRIDFADWDDECEDPTQSLVNTVQALKLELSARHGSYYLFGEIPSEDLTVIQALGISGAKLIETRLTYFHDNLREFDWSERCGVRAAVSEDIPNLRETAIKARNAYDRFHADSFFSSDTADSFLATFIENSVKGFADIVLVPADNHPPTAFLTGKFAGSLNSDTTEKKLARVVLSAVGTKRRGWNIKLTSELTYWFRKNGADIIYMSTQSTNRAVVRVWEILGYRFGRASHVFSACDSK